jgi:hypothetical protein
MGPPIWNQSFLSADWCYNLTPFENSLLHEHVMRRPLLMSSLMAWILDLSISMPWRVWLVRDVLQVEGFKRFCG